MQVLSRPALFLTLLPTVLSVASLVAQAPLPGVDSRPAKKLQAVSYLFPEQVTIAAGKATPVELHFKVADGLHINSHNPSGEGLIATTLTFPEASGVRLAKADFPPGTDFSIVAGPDIPAEKLSVYTGEFVIHTELMAARGEHLAEATLRYQACNTTTCMPPRTIPVTLDVISK